MFRFLIPALFTFCFSAQSQILDGTLVLEGRKLLTENFTYTYPGTVTGWAIFELAVDAMGNVTSIRLDETNLKSTPSKYELRNKLNQLKFEGATYYPKFQHVRIKLNVVKEF